MDPKVARTPIGITTGLEAYAVYNTWQPEPTGINSIVERQGIEGMYILPHISKLKWEDPGPEPLVEGSMAALRQTVLSIRKENVFAMNGKNKFKRQTWKAFKYHK